MRPDVLLLIIATLGLLFTEGTRCSRSSNNYVKHRTKPREIRGFKPEFLSTAIGFGKRDGQLTQTKNQQRNNQQNIILALLQKTSQRLGKGRIFCKHRNTYKIAMCEK